MTQFLKLIQSVSDQILSKKLLKPNQLLLVTVSGGQDSVCLFLILLHLKNQWKWKIHIVYCNHLWQTDSFFITKQLVKFTKLFQTPLYLAITSMNILNEKDARNWRYSIFSRIGIFLTPSLGLKVVNIYDFQKLQFINYGSFYAYPELSSGSPAKEGLGMVSLNAGVPVQVRPNRRGLLKPKNEILIHNQIMPRIRKHGFNKTLFYGSSTYGSSTPYWNSARYRIFIRTKWLKEIGLNEVHITDFTTSYGCWNPFPSMKNLGWFLKENSRPISDLSFLPDSEYLSKDQGSLVGPSFWPLGQIFLLSEITTLYYPCLGYKKSTWKDQGSLVQTKRITRDPWSLTPWGSFGPGHKKITIYGRLCLGTIPSSCLFRKTRPPCVPAKKEAYQKNGPKPCLNPPEPSSGIESINQREKMSKVPQDLSPYNIKNQKFSPKISLVTGHTLNDKIETLLFNLIRGCGLNGIYSLRWKRYIKAEKYKKILLNDHYVVQVHSHFFIINNTALSGDSKRIPIPSIFSLN